VKNEGVCIRCGGRKYIGSVQCSRCCGTGKQLTHLIPDVPNHIREYEREDFDLGRIRVDSGDRRFQALGKLNKFLSSGE